MFPTTTPEVPDNHGDASGATTTTTRTTPEVPGNPGNGSGATTTTPEPGRPGTPEDNSGLPFTGESTSLVLVLTGVVILSGTVVMKRKFSK